MTGVAKQFASIGDEHRAFVEAQQMYFVATAARDGRVNLSPKGLDSLRVVAPDRVLWVNGTGSGNETAAHLLDHPRMTLMFCSFVRPPLILRLYGTARAVHRPDPDWADLVAQLPPLPGARTVFDLHVDLVQTSCGFGVPEFEFVAQRDVLPASAERRGPEGLRAYWREKNMLSIDGRPTGLPLD